MAIRPARLLLPVVLLAALPVPAVATGPTALLFRGGLASAKAGFEATRLFDWQASVVDAGLGLGYGRFGFILGTRVACVAPGDGGDYTLSLTSLPVEVDVTCGLEPDRSPRLAVFYLHAALSAFHFPYFHSDVGVGAKWRFSPVSLGVQAWWRRYVMGLGYYAEHVGVGVTLDVGGWWAVEFSPYEMEDVDEGEQQGG